MSAAPAPLTASGRTPSLREFWFLENLYEASLTGRVPGWKRLHLKQEAAALGYGSEEVDRAYEEGTRGDG